jgi:hypothetical protein
VDIDPRDGGDPTSVCQVRLSAAGQVRRRTLNVV